MKKNISVSLLLLLIVHVIYGQEALGNWGSNYGGVASSFQNPALIANSRLYKDINLVGGGFSFYHNVEYLEDTMSNGKNFFHDVLGLPHSDARRNYYKANRPSLDKGYLMSRELGPSYMLDRGTDAFSITLSTRQFASFNQIPDVISRLIKNGYADIATVAQRSYAFEQPMRAAGMSWAEIAGTYARRLPSSSNDLMTLGVTLKFLMGQGGAYAYVNNFNVQFQNNLNVQINQSNLQSGISLPYNYAATSTNVGWNGKVSSGIGFGTDLGFTLIHRRFNKNTVNSNRYCDQEFEDYDYRLSVALLDIGAVKFNSNTRSLSTSNSTPVYYNLSNFSFHSTQNAIDQVLSLYNIKGADSLNTFKHFSVILPTAISLQYDVRIMEKVYSTLATVIAVPLGKNSIIRPSQIALIPRYESDHFEISLPLSLYEFVKPRLGLALRIYCLTIGTDRLISMGGASDYFGYDAYASIRINFMKFFKASFIKGECPESSKSPCW
jgi:hypothetical protein